MGIEEEIDEEYEVWKKNAPFLYELVISHPLEWPSLTVHWIPNSCDLLFGTHTTDEIPNFLMIAECFLPSDSDPSLLPGIEVIQKIRVDGEVNKALCMIQNTSIIGAKTNNCDVYVFDSSKQKEKTRQDKFDPDLRLKGHENEGYGLSWSPLKQGFLVSGSHDKKICVWDISSSPENKSLNALHVFAAHESVVGDVSWHLKDENLFGSVGDDCQLRIWDMRTHQAELSVKAHEQEINGLAFNPHHDWIVATASSDNTVGLFDTRKLSVALHVLSGHSDEVYQVEWDPNHEAVLASGSQDRRVNVWDLHRIGEEQVEMEAEDGPPELLFSHGGHKAKISDFSWNHKVPWQIASVAEDNTLQVWQMSENIYRDDDDDLSADADSH